MHICRVASCLTFLTLALLASAAQAQKGTATLKPPEPGYVYPAGGRAGTTVDVQLGGFDWTPDLQFFVFDSRVKLEPAGTPGPILVPPPPYWFGAKSTIAPLPLPREQAARITLPADLPPGSVRWAVANANGASVRTGTFWVGTDPEVLEAIRPDGPQVLPALPVTVSGRLSRNEEVDQYRFTAPRNGPLTCELAARQLGVNLNAAVTIRDAQGQVVADAVDTDGQDVRLTFQAKADTTYTLSLHDLDFRGDRSFVYRLTLTPGPRILAVLPAVGKRGETRELEFVGPGLATGGPRLEAVKRAVALPADPQRSALAYRLETPWGTTPVFDIPLDDRTETVAGAEQPLGLPAAVTGAFEQGKKAVRYSIVAQKGEVLDLRVEARRFGSPLDVVLVILNAEGKELARNDDLPGTTDAGLTFTAPLDGTYTLEVADQSGQAGTRAAIYRLVVERSGPAFTLQTVARLNVPVGGKTDLTVTARRLGGFKEPITLKVAGLPDGVTVPADLVIPAGKNDLKIAVQAAADAPAVATLVRVTGTAGALTQTAQVPLAGNLTPSSPDDERTDAVLLATTLTPRLKLIAVEADGGRKVHRGATHPAEVLLERLEGYAGPVSLQMASVQSYQRQGITGPDLVVPAADTRAFYPCFMPEWLETTRTSRMALVGVLKVADARGTERYLVTPMSGQITMSIEGALLKVSPQAGALRIRPGDSLVVPVSVLRSAKLTEPVRLELQLPEELQGLLKAEPVTVTPGQTTVEFRITCANDAKSKGRHSLTIRGTALQQGHLAVVSEASLSVE